jgi:putative membrane protein
MMMWHWGFGEWWYGLLGFFLTAAFWVVIVLVVAALVRGRESDDGRGTQSSTPAVTILEERYARGEISREEFLERRSVLTERPEAPR